MSSAGTHLSRLLAAAASDDYWEVVDEVIAGEGSDEATELAVTWSTSAAAEVRALALDVLAHVAQRGTAVAVEHVVELAEGVHADDPADLRWSAAHALTCIDVGVATSTRERAITALIRFASDPDSEVRAEVPCGLWQLESEHAADTTPAVRTLVHLLRDPAPDVRDVAALAFQVVRADSAHIRDELLALTGVGGEGGAEAAVALAERGDVRVVPVVRTNLEREDVGNIWFEAAAALPDPVLLPVLRRLAETTSFDGDAPEPRLTWNAGLQQALAAVTEAAARR